jgi:hypothetical protein
MPGCTVEREVVGITAWYRVGGRFEGASAWDLARRIQSEPLGEAALDFSQCGEFADYGIAVLATALQEVPKKHIQLVGLRQHQARLFKYFGVDVGDALHDAQEETASLAPKALPAHEVA